MSRMQREIQACSTQGCTKTILFETLPAKISSRQCVQDFSHKAMGRDSRWRTLRAFLARTYKHFPEKRDLLAAVAARGFEALAERMLSSLDGLTDARARLLACGQAFVARGVTNPALYRLMFSAALTSPDAGRPAIEKTAAAKARAIVDATFADAARSGAFPSSMGKSARRRGSISGNVVHTARSHYALAIDDFVGPPEEVETLVGPILGALLNGICVASASATCKHLVSAAALVRLLWLY
jgi:AcrR family transcriptional regulator